MTRHPEFENPPCLAFQVTDEDYALVINVWRRQMGLKPIV